MLQSLNLCNDSVLHFISIKLLKQIRACGLSCCPNSTLSNLGFLALALFLRVFYATFGRLIPPFEVDAIC